MTRALNRFLTLLRAFPDLDEAGRQRYTVDLTAAPWPSSCSWCVSPPPWSCTTSSAAVSGNGSSRFSRRTGPYRSLRDLAEESKWCEPLELHLVRVELPTGEVEALLTTLMHRRRFHHKRIGELYSLRWGVEVRISHLKSFLHLAVTPAYTQPGVE